MNQDKSKINRHWGLKLIGNIFFLFDFMSLLRPGLLASLLGQQNSDF
jgi:hypothetical protein